MDNKTRPIHTLSSRGPPQNERYTQTKSKEMERETFHANGKEKKDEVAILIYDKIHFN